MFGIIPTNGMGGMWPSELALLDTSTKLWDQALADTCPKALIEFVHSCSWLFCQDLSKLG